MEQQAVVSFEDARRATDELVKIIHARLSQIGITPAEVVKGGSLGHGTAVPGEYDLDLVIYTNDIDKAVLAGRARSERPFGEWLDKVERFLRSALGSDFRSLGNTPHAICFNYKNQIDVDLLVSPVWDQPHDFYRFLQDQVMDTSKRFSFSVGASKWQVDFYSHQDPQVKEFARRAKVWRNRMWHGVSEGKPKSYFLSLLVLKAYETAKTKHYENLALHIHWERFYQLSSTGYAPQNKAVERSPCLLDPANPYNNMYKTGIGPCRTRCRDYEEGDGNWTLLVRNIETVDLTRPVEEHH